MTEKKNTPEIEHLAPVEAPAFGVIPEDTKTFRLEDFAVILRTLKAPTRKITVAPTNTPKTWVDSVQFYDTGGVRRLYVFINGSWRYVVLT